MDARVYRELRAAVMDYPRRRVVAEVEESKPVPLLASVMVSRDGFRIGHERVSDPAWPCKWCGLVRLEQLDDITDKGGHTWAILPCSCKSKNESALAKRGEPS